jgi:uncharacterized protein YdhG (YjbR/CyaY superfamily)
MRKAGNPAPKDIDEYLARLSEPARTTLHKLRATVRSVLPAEASETMSYGMPAFRYKGPLLYFSAFAKHCSLFPGNASLIAKFKDDLKGYATTKGTIRFPSNKGLPVALVKKLVKARVADNERKQK